MRRQISSLKSMTLLSNLGVWDGFCVQERGQILFGIWLWSGPVCYDVWLPLGLQIWLMNGVHHYREDGGIKWLWEALFQCMECKLCYCVLSHSCFSNTCVIGLPERCSSLSNSDFSQPTIIPPLSPIFGFFSANYHSTIVPYIRIFPSQLSFHHCPLYSFIEHLYEIDIDMARSSGSYVPIRTKIQVLFGIRSANEILGVRARGIQN